MRTIAVILCVCALIPGTAAGAAEQGLTIKGVRYFSYPGFTRIVFEAEAAAPYVMTRSSDGRAIYFSSYGGPFTLTASQLPAISDSTVRGLEYRKQGDHRAVFVLLAPGAGESKDFVLRGPDRVVLDIFHGTAPEAQAGRTGGRAVVVVLDPGHGGADSGVVTPQGQEKTIDLDLAHQVARSLKKSGTKMTVLLTRAQDTAVTADERAAVANAADARVFVSIHAAAGGDHRVMILDLDEGQAVTTGGRSGDFLNFDAANEQQQTQWGSQQAEHSQESGRLGRSIVRALTGREAAEPDQAPLAVLRPVGSAAVVVEAGAAQNRAKTAEAIARGIEAYVREQR